MDSKQNIFPFPVIQDLTEVHINRWKNFYRHPLILSRNACIEEGLWRRTQTEGNKEASGWKTAQDKRRRMLHYEYKYDLLELSHELVMTKFYLWWHVCMPKTEIDIYSQFIYSSLQFGGWNRVYGTGYEEVFSYKNLYARVTRYPAKDNIHDRKSGRSFPDNYDILEVSLFSSGNFKDKSFILKPWEILDTGLRKKDVRGAPVLNRWDELGNFFPAQVELGCGPSIEAGIPPLHFLHDIYSVTDSETGQFILSPYKDYLIRTLIDNPKEALKSLSEVYRKCFLAELTEFYQSLKVLQDRGYLVGPVITNNFDGLTSRAGLEELFVRRYEESHIVPEIEFHPDAKSLIVVGSHADRRKIQHRARAAGLRVVYVDPEGYTTNNNFIPYPLESAQDGDYLFQVTAEKFSSKIKEIAPF